MPEAWNKTVTVRIAIDHEDLDWIISGWPRPDGANRIKLAEGTLQITRMKREYRLSYRANGPAEAGWFIIRTFERSQHVLRMVRIGRGPFEPALDAAYRLYALVRVSMEN